MHTTGNFVTTFINVLATLFLKNDKLGSYFDHQGKANRYIKLNHVVFHSMHAAGREQREKEQSVLPQHLHLNLSTDMWWNFLCNRTCGYVNCLFCFSFTVCALPIAYNYVDSLLDLPSFVVFFLLKIFDVPAVSLWLFGSHWFIWTLPCESACK